MWKQGASVRSHHTAPAHSQHYTEWTRVQVQHQNGSFKVQSYALQLVSIWTVTGYVVFYSKIDFKKKLATTLKCWVSDC